MMKIVSEHDWCYYINCISYWVSENGHGSIDVDTEGVKGEISSPTSIVTAQKHKQCPYSLITKTH